MADLQASRPLAAAALTREEAAAQLRRALSAQPGFAESRRAADGEALEGLRVRHKLALLRALLTLPDPSVGPSLDPFAPLGHAIPDVEEALGIERGEALGLLEDLADLGLVAREHVNNVHLCVRCNRCHLNFRETCPSCGSIEIGIERLVHHFGCAYAGPEPEFARGVDLVCPKCERTLHQLGQDFDRPGDTYVCRDGEHVFDEPRVECQCLACAALFPGHEARVHEIHSYRATALATRAVELNRLTGLDLAEMLHDAGMGIATRTFFLVELERELLRLAEASGAFTIVSLTFSDGTEAYPLFRRLSAEALRTLARTLTVGLRGLDLVCRWDAYGFALFLLGADAVKAAGVRVRLQSSIQGCVLQADHGGELVPLWRARTYLKAGVDVSDAVRFLDGEEGRE